MKYTERILKHPEFIELQKKIRRLEEDRIYCHHELEHGLDVARMAWIYFLEDCQKCGKILSEDKLEEKKDYIYAGALLHDIGRAGQYERGIHHSVCGKEIAQRILKDIAFPGKQGNEILEMISEHHRGEDDQSAEYSWAELYIKKADHDSRNCFFCEAYDSCKWKEEKRNKTIRC